MANSILTPLQMTAGEGLLQNQGLAVNAEFVTAIATTTPAT
jgi:membrane peptidoglycan carboxypeptidase